MGGDVADVFEGEGQGEGVGDGVDVVQAGGEEELAGQELGDGAVDHVRIAQGVLLAGRLVVGHEFGDFLARDGGVRLGRDVAVQQQAQPEQHDGLHPAQGALLAQDAGAGAAADGLGIHRAQDGDLAFVVQLQRQEQLGEAAAQDQLVVQERGPQFFVAAAVDVRALQQLHQGLADLHGEHAGVAREQRGAVHEGVPGGDRERVAARVSTPQPELRRRRRPAVPSVGVSSVIVNPS